jgi:hypothetical protein
MHIQFSKEIYLERPRLLGTLHDIKSYSLLSNPFNNAFL